MVDVWSAVIGGVTGVVGSGIGAALNEVLRRASRIESFSAQIFEKRLAAYEGLLTRMRAGYTVASEVMQSDQFSPKQRHEVMSTVFHDLASFTDAHELYLDDDLRGHCVATFMGAEDVMGLDDRAERDAIRDAVLEMYREARRMIREDSGVAQVDRLLKRIARPRLDGDFIHYLRAQRRKHR